MERPRRLTFGDVWPEELPKGMPMAYAGRASCGHVRWVIRDSGPVASAAALEMGLQGLTAERIPWDEAEAARGSCWQCDPEQGKFGL